MPVSIALHYEGGQEPCAVCGASPTFRGVLTLGDNTTVKLEPRCLNCLITRVIQGVAMVDAPKVTRSAPSHRTKKLSQNQEREIMEDIGGRTQPASGARSGYKGDGRLYGRVRMEAKLTTVNTFGLKSSDLSKIRGECVGNEKPALIVDFKDKRTGQTKDRWAVIPYEQWKDIVNASDDS